VLLQLGTIAQCDDGLAKPVDGVRQGHGRALRRGSGCLFEQLVAKSVHIHRGS